MAWCLFKPRDNFTLLLYSFMGQKINGMSGSQKVNKMFEVLSSIFKTNDLRKFLNFGTLLSAEGSTLKFIVLEDETFRQMPRFSMDSFERSLNSPQLSSKLTIV
jgi:hypothetical protein